MGSPNLLQIPLKLDHLVLMSVYSNGNMHKDTSVSNISLATTIWLYWMSKWLISFRRYYVSSKLFSFKLECLLKQRIPWNPQSLFIGVHLIPHLTYGDIFSWNKASLLFVYSRDLSMWQVNNIKRHTSLIAHTNCVANDMAWGAHRLTIGVGSLIFSSITSMVIHYAFIMRIRFQTVVRICR